MSEQNHSEEQLRKRKKGVTGREQLRQSHGGPRGTHPIDFSIGRSSWLTGEEGGASKGGRRHGDSLAADRHHSELWLECCRLMTDVAGGLLDQQGACSWSRVRWEGEREAEADEVSES